MQRYQDSERRRNNERGIVRVCVCVCERERERDIQRERERANVVAFVVADAAFVAIFVDGVDGRKK